MTANGWLQIFLFLALVFAVTKPLGIFMARVFGREKTFMDPVLRPVERLPFCIVGALLLVSQGVVQNLRPYDHAALIEPQQVQTTGADGKAVTNTVAEQIIAQGPVASQEIIKEWGTNGGGFFNANSAHPFENPTPLTNFIEMFAIFAISAGLTWTLGDMTGSRRHGWAVWAAMAFLFLAGVSTLYWAEARGNPMLTSAGADQTAGATAPARPMAR